jgi:signal transduction histidine kinase
MRLSGMTFGGLKLRDVGQRWRMTRVLGLILVGALVVAGFLAMLYDRQVFQTQKVREISVQASILAATASAALLFEDQVAAQEYVTALQVNPDVDAVGLYTAGGVLLASYVRPESQPLRQTPEIGPPRFEDEFVSISLPVRESGVAVGSVYLRATVEPLGRRVARYGVIAVLLILGAVVLVVLANAHGAVSRANVELEARANELAAANTALQNEISEREKAEAALRQSQKMEAVGQLSGGIAHDFNNLLTAIRGNLQLLQKRLPEHSDTMAQYVQAAQDGLQRATNLTQRILAFSRQQALTPVPTDLNALIRGMTDLLRHSLGESVTVDADLAPDLWWTECDANQMEICILNLAINARDAMPDGGRLTLRTANKSVGAIAADMPGLVVGDYVTVCLSDSGTGMSAEVREKAFEPFFTTKPPGQGTGLGLSMVFGYVKQSNGYVHIDSTIGRGTTITLYMPRYHGRVPAGVAPVPAVRAPLKDASASQAATILVVEDELIVRMVTVEILQDEGYHVLDAGGGAEAFRVIESDKHIDLLCTDVRLPDINGYQLAEMALKKRPDLKILLMTGYTKDPLPEPMAAAGVQTVYKPFDLDDFVEVVSDVLRTPRIMPDA